MGTIYIKYHRGGQGSTDFHWKCLCYVFDNEARGMIERAFGKESLKFEPDRLLPPRPTLELSDDYLTEKPR